MISPAGGVAGGTATSAAVASAACCLASWAAAPRATGGVAFGAQFGPLACCLPIRLAALGERLVVGRDADRNRRVQIHASYALRDLVQLLFVLRGQP